MIHLAPSSPRSWRITMSLIVIDLEFSLQETYGTRLRVSAFPWTFPAEQLGEANHCTVYCLVSTVSNCSLPRQANKQYINQPCDHTAGCGQHVIILIAVGVFVGQVLIDAPLHHKALRLCHQTRERIAAQVNSIFGGVATG